MDHDDMKNVVWLFWLIPFLVIVTGLGIYLSRHDAICRPNSAVSTNAQTGLSKNRKFTGSGSDQDIVISSARAYVSALNKLSSWGMRRDMQEMAERKNKASTTTQNGEAVPNGTEQVVTVRGE